MTFTEFTELLIVTKSKSYMVTRNILCLLSVIFSDEVVKVTFLILPLDRHLFHVLSGD